MKTALIFCNLCEEGEIENGVPFVAVTVTAREEAGSSSDWFILAGNLLKGTLNIYIVSQLTDQFQKKDWLDR